jgi:hypothetical protein
MASKNYTKLGKAWDRVVQNVSKPALVLASLSELLPPVQPLIDDIADHAKATAAKLRGP